MIRKLLGQRFSRAWLVIVGSGVLLEILALLVPSGGDTLSEHVWAFLRLHPALWFLGFGAGLWAMWHFFWRTRPWR